MIPEEAPLRRQGKERSTVTAAKMSDNKATDSTEKDIGRIFKDMSYATVQEGCGVAESWLSDHGRALNHFINGEWTVGAGQQDRHTVSNPATEKVYATVLKGQREEVQAAVTAAAKAFVSWGKLPDHGRAKHLYSIARHVQKHQSLLSVVESMESGKPARESREVDTPAVVRHFYHHAGWAQLMTTELNGSTPLGCVLVIPSSSCPLLSLARSVAPALAMGNTVIVKPALQTPLAALLFAEICTEAGLPPGVINVVTGDDAFEEELAVNAGVKSVTFTGTTERGRSLRRLLAGSGKKLSLQLSGKSAAIIFDSADVDSAIEGVTESLCFSQGQVAWSMSRLLVQETIFESFMNKLKTRLKRLRVGDGLDKTCDVGALVSQDDRLRLAAFVDDARSQGAEVFQPDVQLPQKGCFYPPTVITNAHTASNVSLEAVPGPLIVAMSFRTAKEAIALSNASKYGLAASIWTETLSLGLEVAMAIKVGTVWLNGYNMSDAAAGMGGCRQSGFGRDGGKEGLYQYVRPAWQETVAPPAGESVDYTKFGASPPNNAAITKDVSDADDKARVDKTYKLYYGGGQKRPDSQSVRAVTGKGGRVVGHISEGSRKDIRNAVEAANKAAPGWGKKPGHNRAQILFYVAENLDTRRAEFASQLMLCTDCSLEEGQRQVDLSVQRLFHWAAYCDKHGGSVQETPLCGATVKLHEPVGVVGIICPQVAPLLGFVSLFAPAVARGNCVVIVPSMSCPLPALDLYQVFDTSDVPVGVVNIITGDRDHLTKHLAEHHDVQAMWYFGSGVGSKFVESAAAENMKRTWVNYGMERNWEDCHQGQGEEFLRHAVHVKNVWMPMGEIFAN